MMVKTMLFALLFLLELILVFFLSRILTRSVSDILLLLTKNQRMTVTLLSLLFIPGVVLHELSHMLMAELLFVPVGHMEFLPKVHGSSVKLGSVAVAKTDPIRRFFIGVAPLLGGLLCIFIAGFFFIPRSVFSLQWQTFFLFYIIFEIGNTMFSSKKDLEGAIGFFIFVGLFLSAFFFLGFRIPFSFFTVFSLPQVAAFFQKMDIFLLVLIGIDTLVCGSIQVIIHK